MRNLIFALLAVAGPAFAGPVPPVGCPNCILSTASPQEAQINIGTAAIRGSLNVSTGTFIYLYATNFTASQFIGGGAGVTALNASALASGTVPAARLAGSYTGITGLGTVAVGTWQGTAVAPQYGGTGQNWSAVNRGALPFFNATGAMSTLAPGTANSLLQANGAGADPSWTAAPTVLGTNVTAIPLANLVTGNLPSAIKALDGSLVTVAGTKVTGDISGGAATLTVPLPVANLGSGQFPTSNPASSVTATGTPTGTFGGPSQIAQIRIGWDGRVYDAHQYNLVLPSSGIAPGALPAGVTLAVNQLTTGTWPTNIPVSSVGANGVVAGVYGGATLIPQVTIAPDGRVTSVTQIAVSGVANAAVTDLDNHWTHVQTSSSVWYFYNGISVASVTASGGFWGPGPHVTGLDPANLIAGPLTPGVTLLASGLTGQVSVNNGGTGTMDRTLQSSSLVTSIDFESRVLEDDQGGKSGDWNAHQLWAHSGANLMLDWTGPGVAFSTNIVGVGSVTGSAFFGDASHLTGIPGPTFLATTGKVDFSSGTNPTLGFHWYGSSSVLTGTTQGSLGWFGRCHLGPESNPTPCPTDSNLAIFGGSGWDGTTYPDGNNTMGNIAFRSTGTPSGGNHGAYMVVNLTPVNTTTRGEVLRITSAGRLGLGTSIPATLLDINGSAQFGSGATKSTFTTTGALTMASGAALTLAGAAGNFTSASSVTAASFWGDASHLSNVPAPITVSTLSVIGSGLAIRAPFSWSDVSSNLLMSQSLGNFNGNLGSYGVGVSTSLYVVADSTFTSSLYVNNVLYVGPDYDYYITPSNQDLRVRGNIYTRGNSSSYGLIIDNTDSRRVSGPAGDGSTLSLVMGPAAGMGSGSRGLSMTVSTFTLQATNTGGALSERITLKADDYAQMILSRGDGFNNGYLAIAVTDVTRTAYSTFTASSFQTSSVTIGGGSLAAGDALTVNTGSATVAGLIHAGWEHITNACGAGVTTCTASCSAGKYATGGGCNTAAVTGVAVLTGDTGNNFSHTCTTVVATTITSDVYCTRVAP